MKYTVCLEFNSKSRLLQEKVTNGKVLSLVVNRMAPDISKGNLLVIADEGEDEFSLSDLIINCNKVESNALSLDISKKEVDELILKIKNLEKSLKLAETKLNKINDLSRQDTLILKEVSE